MGDQADADELPASKRIRILLRSRTDLVEETCPQYLQGKPKSLKDSCDIILVLDTGEKLPAHKCAPVPSSSAEAPFPRKEASTQILLSKSADQLL